MQAFQMGEVREIYVAMGTKFGKSIGAGTCMARVLLDQKNKGKKYRWIAPIYDQAKIGMDYIKGLVPPDPHSVVEKSAMRITLPYNGTEVKFYHTKDPVSLEGAGIHGVIHDEAAKQPYDAVVSSRTTTTFTKGPSMYISTPWGKNWFYHGCMEAKEQMEWALKKGVPPTKIFLTARTADNPFVDKDVIAAAKKELPKRLFEQYYLAQFVDDGTVFTGVQDCIYGPRIEVEGSHQYCVAQDSHNLNVVIGVDWAKKEDFTVFGAFDYNHNPPRMVGFERFQGISYIEAVKELYKFCRKFRSVGVIYHDRTGVGETLDELLGQLPYAYEGIMFTTQTKSHMVNNFMLALEKKEIQLLDWPEMVKELDAYEVTVSELGISKYSAPRTMHDDIVAMLILANSAVQDYRGDSMDVRILEDLPNNKLTVDKWYRDMLEEAEDAEGDEGTNPGNPASLFSIFR